MVLLGTQVFFFLFLHKKRMLWLLINLMSTHNIGFCGIVRKM